MTGFSQDEVSIALHDCNFDTQAAINTLIEGRQDQVAELNNMKEILDNGL